MRIAAISWPQAFLAFWPLIALAAVCALILLYLWLIEL